MEQTISTQATTNPDLVKVPFRLDIKKFVSFFFLLFFGGSISFFSLSTFYYELLLPILATENSLFIIIFSVISSLPLILLSFALPIVIPLIIVSDRIGKISSGRKKTFLNFCSYLYFYFFISFGNALSGVSRIETKDGKTILTGNLWIGFLMYFLFSILIIPKLRRIINSRSQGKINFETARQVLLLNFVSAILYTVLSIIIGLIYIMVTPTPAK